ncbi:MAG: hypothetical protein JWR52_2589 [Marmoricola sp.]|nr:hypothetical protein [Marmoricola sp.]
MLELTIRLVVSLSIVVGLLLLLARFGARKFRGNSGALVHVVHRQPLSRTTSVAVVTVGSRVLVLGTTEQHVSVLTELDADELEIADVLELAGPALVDESAPAPVSKPLTLARSAGSHRAQTTAAVGPGGALAGSVLSFNTWRQAFTAATSRTSRRAS